MNEIKEYTEKIFEDIKHIDELGNEYWLARELMKALEYKEWRKFYKVIKKAIEACTGSNHYTLDHFVFEDKMVNIGSNAIRKIDDYKLSRYACYLIVQNCNPRIKIIALAQTYFAIQTRKQELFERKYNELTEDEKRLYRRNQARKGNLNLNQTAVNSGVKDLDKIMKDIKKDSKKEENRLGYSDSSITYSYLNNGTYENYTNINEIGKKLFK